MSIIVQEGPAEETDQVTEALNDQLGSFYDSDPLETDASATSIANAGTITVKPVRRLIRQFQPMRFAIGLICTASGVALILGIGLRIIEIQNLSSDVSTPLIAICVLTGVMLLGGGFGVMATSSSEFDDAEFDRLAVAGNISAVDRSDPERSAPLENEETRQSAA